MNKEFYDSRLLELQQQHRSQEQMAININANIQAINGAIQECNYHLKQLAELAAEEVKE